ncbi:hypothetical protein BTO30_06420 [Domibacillus antri]|uniref:Solute-binding protein family 3/N-terminal domain-containing protein n=1 Tax=Domibacillus antri TaxID=1714264 RepID=A0A1Q8Q6Q0_9BACI|nr:ABC transporter substrate-binding protein [Domibacillus antri]OLN23009.1 hypothetical protein BTO30_06420 [Domibacillus antri]
MKISRKAKFGRLLLFVLLLVFTTACSNSQSPDSAPDDKASADSDVPLNIGTLKIGALTNLYAAEKLGYFKEQGLKVTFTQMGGGAELLPAVSAGKIDITLSTPSPAIQANEKGFDFKMVMQNEVAAEQDKDSQALFVLKDSGIKSIKELKGKRIAVNNIGSQMWLSVAEVLDENGIDKNEVDFIELPFSNMEDSLSNKQVDAVFNVEPFTTKMNTNGAFNIISYAAMESLPKQPLGAFWASEKWYKDNEETAEKFVEAMNKTNEYLAGHPDETKQFMADYTEIDLSLINKMMPILWDSKVDENTVQALLDLMKKHELLKDEMDAESVLFPSALK